jgi:hypothetical protein
MWRLYRSEQGPYIEMPKTVSTVHEAARIALFIGLTLSVIVSTVNASPPRLGDMQADEPEPSEWVNGRKPLSRWTSDTRQYLTASDKAVAPPRSKKDEAPRPRKEEPVEQNQPPEGLKSISPVGVAPEGPTTISPVGIAPEGPQEALPPSIVRMFDMPGAGVLTPKGTLIVEPYLQYAHLTNNRVTLIGFTIVPALTIGLINIQGVSRDIYTAAFVGRYGLTNRLEVELRVPYIYRQDAITQRPLATPSTADTVSTATGHGIGDIETTARYRINTGGPDLPYFVGFTRFKTTTGKGPFQVPQDPITGLQTELPTGSGFYILQPGVTFLFPSDPVVIFGSMSYIWNIPRNEGGEIGRVNPGSGANANLGLGISLNEKVSLSLGYDHTVFERPTSSSNLLLTTTPSITQIGVLLIGGAYRLSDRSFVNFVVGVGATREAPDLQVTVRIPTAVFSRK